MKEFGYLNVSEIENSGVVVLRDLMLTNGEKSYALSVATPAYIESLKNYNKQFDKELQIDDNILPLDSVADLDNVVEQLKQMPLEVVKPYLVPQRTGEAE